MTEPLIWREETRKLSELKPYDKNPRCITKKEYERLVESIKLNGYMDRIKIDIDNVIPDGNHRLKALKECGYHEVQVLVPNRQLSEQEFRRIVIQANKSFAEYDYEILANEWDAGDLNEWGYDVPFNSEEVEKPVKHTDPDPTKDVCTECGRTL